MAQQAALRKKPAARKAKEEKLYPFKWEGKDRKGTRIDGVLQGENAALVKTQLRKQGILVTKIKRESTLFGKRPKPIKPLDIAFFTRQLATMMESGVPIIQAFEIIAEGAENPSVGKLVTQIKTDVAAGNTLADSLRQHPKYFDDLFCNLVESGEQSGRLESLLDRIEVFSIAPWIVCGQTFLLLAPFSALQKRLRKHAFQNVASNLKSSTFRANDLGHP